MFTYSDMRPFKFPSKKALAVIFSASLVLRLAFSFFLSRYYFGEISFTFGDTESFTRPFLNLLTQGVYTFDVDNIDAYLYRPPVYPLFWGLHYLLFGSASVYKAVAFTQSLIDSASAVLCVLLAARLGCSRRWALFAGAIYVINPVLLVHVPISGTETLAIFLTLASVLLALFPWKSSSIFWSALLLALAAMTRQYLGILLPISLIYLAYWCFQSGGFSFANLGRKAVLYLLSFCLFVSPWFLRNAFELGIPTILMGKTTGYAIYQEDYLAMRDFYNLYFINITPPYYSIGLRGSDEVSDSEQFGDLAEEAYAASQLAGRCGPSFLAVRSSRMSVKDEHPNISTCKDEVVASYKDLRAKALESGGALLFFKAPAGNIFKSIFKQELVQAQSNPLKGLAIRSIFLFRSAYEALGLLSIIWLWKKPESVYLLFPTAIILLISFYYRQVEIRYLAQVEALLIPYCAYSADRLYALVKRSSPDH